MAFDSKKTILLEKTYLYVRASLGFQLEGTSTEKIPTNNGFYRFFVDNLQKAIGNSYVNILYDSQDLTLQCFCSDLYMDELMSSDSSAIEDVVEELKKNISTILEFENGVSSGFESNHQDNVALHGKISEFEAGVSSALASLHEDNVSIQTPVDFINNYFQKYIKSNLSLSAGPFVNTSGPSEYPRNFTFFINASNFTNKLQDGNFLYNFHTECYNPIYYQGSCTFKVLVDGFPNGFINANSVPYLGFCTVKYISSDGSLMFYRQKMEIGTSSLGKGLSTSIGNFKGTILSVDMSIFVNSDFYNKLVFISDSVNFNKYSFFGNNLVFHGLEFFSSCCNQDFDLDFKGGYLDFRFYSKINIDWIKNFDYVFITDVGECVFSGESLALHYYNSDSNLVVCGNLPNIVSPLGLDVNKLLGVRVRRSSKVF